MITAKEARALSVDCKQEWLSYIEAEIRKAAENKKMKVIIRKAPMCDWLFPPKTTKILSKEENEVLDILRNAGYKLSFFYCDGSQFSDFGLLISWE